MSASLKKTASLPRAFTLIELLVVVAVIVILAALCLPIISRISESSRQVTCTGNVRALVGAMTRAAQDNGGRFPLLVGAYDDPEFVRNPASFMAQYLETDNTKVWHCPSDSGLGVWHNQSDEKSPTRSYSFNSYLVTSVFGRAPALNTLSNLSKTILITENWTGWRPSQTNGSDCDNIFDLQGRGGDYAIMHDNANRAIFGFVDGHAEKLNWRQVSPTGVPGRGLFAITESARDGL